MTAYLYGSSIQGIQKFIFETNKLKEIVGASELVEQLSNEQFFKEFKVNENDMIMYAAGNIRLMSNNEDLIKEIVRTWPKIVAAKAPGLILSQALVKIEGKLTREHFDKLENRLRIARNKQYLTQPISLMAVIRSRRTGKAAVDCKDEGKPRDISSKVKQEISRKDAHQNLMEKSLGKNSKQYLNLFAADTSDMLFRDDETGWLAVVHADGNSLGKLIQAMAQKLEKDNQDLKEAFKRFSEALNKSTIAAARYAIEQIILPEKNTSKKLPFRPVIIGGDDLTIILRADLALPFTELYLNKFTEYTLQNFDKLARSYSLKMLRNGLTACAGIAYMKESFPFHYAAGLAENLCADAKKHAKKINQINVPSALLFHKIHDSFVEDYHEIERRELTTPSGISFKFGPYSINGSDLPSLKELIEQADLILERDAPKSGIRKWLGLLYEDRNKADLWLERVKDITEQKYIEKLKLETPFKPLEEENTYFKTHLFDVLTIASISPKNKMEGR